jgi:UDP-glucose 4-epimerase
LVAGGIGYIGAHAAVQLLEAGQTVVVLEVFCNNKSQAIDRIVAIVHRYPILVKGNLWLVAVILDIFFNFIIFRFKRPVQQVKRL